MISWQTAAHWPYVEAPFPFYLVFYDRAPRRLGPRSVGMGGRGGEGEEGRPDLSNTNTGASVAGVEYSL